MKGQCANSVPNVMDHTGLKSSRVIPVLKHFSGKRLLLEQILNSLAWFICPYVGCPALILCSWLCQVSWKSHVSISQDSWSPYMVTFFSNILPFKSLPSFLSTIFSCMILEKSSYFADHQSVHSQERSNTISFSFFFFLKIKVTVTGLVSIPLSMNRVILFLFLSFWVWYYFGLQADGYFLLLIGTKFSSIISTWQSVYLLSTSFSASKVR